MMLREIITPLEPVVTVRLPEEMVGKTVEVIAFEIEDTTIKKPSFNREQRLHLIDDLTANTLVDLTNFTFNRDEANNYE